MLEKVAVDFSQIITGRGFWIEVMRRKGLPFARTSDELSRVLYEVSHYHDLPALQILPGLWTRRQFWRRLDMQRLAPAPSIRAVEAGAWRVCLILLLYGVFFAALGACPSSFPQVQRQARAHVLGGDEFSKPAVSCSSSQPCQAFRHHMHIPQYECYYPPCSHSNCSSLQQSLHTQALQFRVYPRPLTSRTATPSATQHPHPHHPTSASRFRGEQPAGKSWGQKSSTDD